MDDPPANPQRPFLRATAPASATEIAPSRRAQLSRTSRLFQRAKFDSADTTTALVFAKVNLADTTTALVFAKLNSADKTTALVPAMFNSAHAPTARVPAEFNSAHAPTAGVPVEFDSAKHARGSTRPALDVVDRRSERDLPDRS